MIRKIISMILSIITIITFTVIIYADTTIYRNHTWRVEYHSPNGGKQYPHPHFLSLENIFIVYG